MNQYSTSLPSRPPSELVRDMLSLILPESMSVNIEEAQVPGGAMLTIHVPREARPMVVGRSGRTIDAIRTLLHCYGGRHGLSVYLKLPDEESRPDVRESAAVR